MLFSANFDDTSFNITSSQDISSTWGEGPWHIQVVIDGSHSRFWTDDGTTGESVPSLRRASSKVVCLQIKGGSSGDRNEFNMKPYDMGFGQKAYVRTWLYLESNFTLGSDPDYEEITDPISTNDGGASYPMVKMHIRTNGSNYNFISFYCPDSNPDHRVFDYANDLWNVAVSELPRGRWFQLSWLVDRDGQTCTSWLTDEGVTICLGDFSSKNLGYPAFDSWKSILAKLYSNFKNKYYRLWCDGWEVWDDLPEEEPPVYPPTVTLISPIGVYSSSEVPLTFYVNESADWIGYSLDAEANVTIEGNTTISAYVGSHSIRVYANNSGGDMGASALEYFSLQYELTFTTYPINTFQGIQEATGAGFNIYVNNGSEIGFQTIATEYNFTFLIYCTSGTWNGTSGTLSMDSNGGSLGFHANDTSILRLYSLTNDELTIGATGGTLTETDMNDYSLAVTSGNDLLITWFHPLPSYLDYTMFGVGMFGVGLLVGCPIWAIKKVKDEGILEPDSIQRVGLAAMLMLIGFGLVIAWLWL